MVGIYIEIGEHKHHSKHNHRVSIPQSSPSESGFTVEVKNQTFFAEFQSPGGCGPGWDEKVKAAYHKASQNFESAGSWGVS